MRIPCNDPSAARVNRGKRITFYQCGQVLGGKRLQQVVAGAGPHRRHRFLDLSVGGHQQYRKPRVDNLDFLQQGKTVHGFHLHVAHHQPYLPLAQQIQRSLPIRGGKDRVAGQSKGGAQRFQQFAIVFNDQNRQRRHIAWLSLRVSRLKNCCLCPLCMAVAK